MNVLELFSGSKSLSNVAQRGGHRTFTVDIEPSFNPDLVMDILDFNTSMVPFVPDVIWASPPCTAFSVAAIGKNWSKIDRSPKSIGAALGIRLVKATLEVIDLYSSRNPDLTWFIENPRGMLRKMPFMQGIGRHITVSYCQYGDTRMKPTDIWTNLSNWTPAQICKRGDPCHESAPRGSRTGTQGIKGAYDRGKIPERLCKEILFSVEAVMARKEPKQTVLIQNG
jgi:hypothetical protein